MTDILKAKAVGFVFGVDEYGRGAGQCGSVARRRLRFRADE